MKEYLRHYTASARMIHVGIRAVGWSRAKGRVKSAIRWEVRHYSGNPQCWSDLNRADIDAILDSVGC